MAVLRLSKSQQQRLETLGATINPNVSVTATEAQLKIAHIGGARRRLLIALNQLTVS